MVTLSQKEEISRILHGLNPSRPVPINLGTPDPGEPAEIARIIAMGVEIEPYLLELASQESAEIVAYIVLILGKLGDPKMLGPLQELRSRYQARKTKTEWDWAVIGQSNVAIDRLQRLQSPG